MRRQGFVFALVILLSTTAWTSTFNKINSESIPHFDLDMSSEEYSTLLSEMGPMTSLDGADPRLQKILDMGKRNLDWLKNINTHRDSTHQISLSSAATQQGFPVDQPRIYNPDIIVKDFQVLIDSVPDAIKSVVLGNSPITNDTPVPDDQFMAWGLKLDHAYQLAARWTLMEGYLPTLAARKVNDVRGYYFLSNNGNVQSELQNWAKLDLKTQSAYRDYLIEMCLNNGVTQTACVRDVDGAIPSNKVFELYSTYLQASKTLWDSFFLIQANRPDVTWKANANEMHVPFRDPNNAKVKSYLSDNIQDEWKWNGWQLFLDFKTGTQTMPEVQFQAGSTPHVNGIAGNVITMDDNAPLTEYDVRWTIRHEFGHVLGFPDCYVEFYDDANKVIVSYQLDITNLMCSRRGHFQQRNYDELKRVYGNKIAAP